MKSEIQKIAEGVQPFVKSTEYIYYKKLLALKHIKSSQFKAYKVYETKAFICGGHFSGKTSLMLYFRDGYVMKFLDFIPHMCKSFTKKWGINDQYFDINFVDTYDNERSDGESSFSYNSLILLCIPNFDSENIERLKMEHDYYSKNNPNSKFLLVRTQIDLKIYEKPNEKSYNFKDGEELAKQLKCILY